MWLQLNLQQSAVLSCCIVSHRSHHHCKIEATLKMCLQEGKLRPRSLGTDSPESKGEEPTYFISFKLKKVSTIIPKIDAKMLQKVMIRALVYLTWIISSILSSIFSFIPKSSISFCLESWRAIDLVLFTNLLS